MIRGLTLWRGAKLAVLLQIVILGTQCERLPNFSPSEEGGGAEAAPGVNRREERQGYPSRPDPDRPSSRGADVAGDPSVIIGGSRDPKFSRARVSITLKSFFCKCLTNRETILTKYDSPLRATVGIQKGGKPASATQEEANQACRREIHKLNTGAGYLNGVPYYNPPIPVNTVSSEPVSQCQELTAMD